MLQVRDAYADDQCVALGFLHGAVRRSANVGVRRAGAVPPAGAGEVAGKRLRRARVDEERERERQREREREGEGRGGLRREFRLLLWTISGLGRLMFARARTHRHALCVWSSDCIVPLSRIRAHTHIHTHTRGELLAHAHTHKHRERERVSEGRGDARED